MKRLILSLLSIVAIEYNLQWNGIENAPNWVNAWDEFGNEVQLVEQRKYEKEIYYWDIYDTNGNLINFIHFWNEE